MAEATAKQSKSWRNRMRGGTVLKSSSKLFDMTKKSSKERMNSQQISIDEGLVDPSNYLDLFATAAQVIGAKKDYFSDVRRMSQEQEIERRPPCDLSKEKESKCRLDDSTREGLYKLLMRVVNGATVLEDRLVEGSKTGATAGAQFSSKEMHKEIQDILNATTEEQKVWQARLSSTAKYQKVLILTVHHAGGLPSADQDGFSDPYCRLGLVPREKSAVEKLTLKSLPDPDAMEKSKIQRKTLDPIWEETFELLLFEQPRVLVMEVWDDDIAQQNEGRSSIKGFRGLKFKIIDFFKPGQDDFLGKRCIDLSTLPNEKTQHTLELHGKSVKKKKGSIQITTEIIVRLQDTELDALRADGEGLSLLRDFLTESARHQYIKDIDVTKDHSMRQIHSFIGDKVIQLLQIERFPQAVVRLGASANYLICLTYEREELKDYLEEVIQKWDLLHTSLNEDVIKSVVENIELIYSHEIGLLKQSRVLFPPNSDIARVILKEIIQVIIITFNFLKRIERVGTETELSLEIEPNIKEDIHSWYQVLNANSQPLQLTNSPTTSTQTMRVTALTNLCSEVAQDLITVHLLYPQAFEQTGISYFDIAYHALDEILSHEVASLLNSPAFKRYLEQISEEDKKGTDETKREQFTFAILILKLYQYVKDISQFKEHIIRDDLRAQKFKFEDYQAWFKPCVLSWMDLAKNISMGTVKRAIEIDTKKIIQDNKIKVTSSALDITICFEQYYQFHRQLSWSHEQDGDLIIAKIVKLICDIGTFYSSQMYKILSSELEKKEKNPVAFEVNEKYCVGINNTQVALEYMREIPTRLEWNELIEEAEENIVVVEEWKKILNSAMESIESNKKKMLMMILTAFTKQFKIYFNDFMKKPADESINDSVDLLINWLGNSFEGSWNTLLHNDFQFLLQGIWNEIVKICADLQKSNSKRLNYCSKLHKSIDIIYNFVHVDGSGLKKEEMETDDYKMLESALSLYGDNTEDIIAIYCSQLCDANKTAEMKYGSLTFSVFHLETENVLKLKLIRGENLPKMDRIGSCDPYIQFKTLPNSLFETVKTKHQNNTQNPTWKLDFDFKMNENPSKMKGACLQLSLYDYDMLNKNDYGGSVYIAIDEIVKDSSEFTDTTLNLMFPIHTQILSAINDRSDKEASKFSKKIRKYLEAESDLGVLGKETGKKSKKKDRKKS